MRYKKAPILEAAIEFRWASAVPMDALASAARIPVFERFEEPKPRRLMSANFDLEAGGVTQEVTEVGFEMVLKDGSERVFLERDKFVYVQSAPYDQWDDFLGRAMAIMAPTIKSLELAEFSRVGVRFINRIDVPTDEDGKFATDDYITIKFDGPRQDKGIVEEFVLRVVKPTQKDNISYALVVASSPSPLPDHSGIVVDIDVFTQTPTSVVGPKLSTTLGELRVEKDEIFESCITEKARALFGGNVK